MNYKIIDGHSHIYPEKIAQKATNSISTLIEGINNTIQTEANKIGVKNYLLNADSIKENLKNIETNIKNSINASIIEVLNN